MLRTSKSLYNYTLDSATTYIGCIIRKLSRVRLWDCAVRFRAAACPLNGLALSLRVRHKSIRMKGTMLRPRTVIILHCMPTMSFCLRHLVYMCIKTCFMFLTF